jgi:hypothetical protein
VSAGKVGGALVIVVALVAVGCSERQPVSEPSSPHAGHTDETKSSAQPLRKGEHFLDVGMHQAYTPSAPYGTGTDDYRCFLLDPKLTEKAFLTGIDVKPGNAKVVHHVILFKVPPDALATARAADVAEKGQGWTCFGGAGIGEGPGALDEAPWIGAWAPGGGEQVFPSGVGIPMPKGSRIVMQVHYNLLAGHAPDTSSARLRLAPKRADLKALDTVLLPAPVELPCRPGHGGRLCDRDAAMADVIKRFGPAGRFAQYFPLLCGEAKPGPVQSCTRRATHAMTIRAAAGHMHLLGRKISIAVNGRTILDIKNWNFDDQGADAVKPVNIKRGDKLTVTCRHSQRMRDLRPALQGQPERYVVWGEGTTDEMCLGILLATRS